MTPSAESPAKAKMVVAELWQVKPLSEIGKRTRWTYFITKCKKVHDKDNPHGFIKESDLD